jgi:hypothetical protein
MANLYTVITVVKQGELRILGVLDGAYGLASAYDKMGEEVGDIFANVIEADSIEDAERSVREKYLPAPDADDEGEEVPC